MTEPNGTAPDLAEELEADRIEETLRLDDLVRDLRAENEALRVELSKAKNDCQVLGETLVAVIERFILVDSHVVMEIITAPSRAEALRAASRRSEEGRSDG